MRPTIAPPIRILALALAAMASASGLAAQTGNQSDITLGHRRMGQVIDSMKEAFDTLIFDSPPLLAASDGAVLASQVDGVLLVIRAEQTDRAVGRRAVEQMEGVGAEVLGAVLSDPDGTVPRYTYSGTYDHRYYTRA